MMAAARPALKLIGIRDGRCILPGRMVEYVAGMLWRAGWARPDGTELDRWDARAAAAETYVLTVHTLIHLPNGPGPHAQHPVPLPSCHGDRVLGNVAAEQDIGDSIRFGGELAAVGNCAGSTIEDAESWYDSAEYAEARAITPAAFKGRTLMFVEGVKAEEA